jgi:pimeloyl-ACP methyl ester carboxylesterase
VTEPRELELAGRRVRWRVAGAGAPLVCVHGLAASSRWFGAVLGPLTERFEVHLVDVPRFSARSGFRPGDAADWLVRWLEAAGLESARLLGHSLGGLVAAQAAARVAPERLVLAAPAGIPAGRRLLGDTFALVTSGRATPRFLPRIAADALRSGPENVVRGGTYVRAVDLTLELARITAPTLLVWGTRDTLVPFRLARRWRDAIPNAQLAALDGVGHISMVEAPAAFLDAALPFLGS